MEAQSTNYKYNELIFKFLNDLIKLTFALQSLADQTEKHLAAKVAKGRRLVRVHVELMRTDLHAILWNIGYNTRTRKKMRCITIYAV